MKNKHSLLDEVNFIKNKSVYYKKKYPISYIKLNILKLYEKLRKYPKGIVSLNTNNKIDFLIKFYACNKAGFITLLSNHNSRSKLCKEELNINYFFWKNKFVKISSKKENLNKNTSIILKTSGSTSDQKYVLISNKIISFITKQMNIEMYKNIKSCSELIFAPCDHAFGFLRIHALMVSQNSLSFTQDINLAKLFDTYKISKSDAISINSHILKAAMDVNYVFFKRNFKDIKYFQVSSGFFPTQYRRKILKSGANMFINYGMTEAMRTTFLNCKKFPHKIHTEGKPFNGVNIRIKKKNNSEILVKGKNLAISYLNKKVWESKLENGWFATGDIGELDKQNFLIFNGRNVDNVNFNGFNYSLNQIENLIKKNFNNINLKIINLSNKKNNFNNELYLFLEKKIDINKIIILLKKNGINIFFKDYFVTKKFKFEKTGKIKLHNFLKYLKND